MSMQTTGDNESGEPMIDMNVTPLIDVMLVLLIMFIITIPMQTHAVKFDLPGQVPPTIYPNRTSNLLVVKADGSLRWNGIPIGRNDLSQELAITRQMSPQPELHLQPELPQLRSDIVDRSFRLRRSTRARADVFGQMLNLVVCVVVVQSRGFNLREVIQKLRWEILPLRLGYLRQIEKRTLCGLG